MYLIVTFIHATKETTCLRVYRVYSNAPCSPPNRAGWESQPDWRSTWCGVLVKLIRDDHAQVQDSKLSKLYLLSAILILYTVKPLTPVPDKLRQSGPSWESKHFQQGFEASQHRTPGSGHPTPHSQWLRKVTSCNPFEIPRCIAFIPKLALLSSY